LAARFTVQRLQELETMAKDASISHDSARSRTMAVKLNVYFDVFTLM
jgi:hypothetical protein